MASTPKIAGCVYSMAPAFLTTDSVHPKKNIKEAQLLRKEEEEATFNAKEEKGGEIVNNV